MRGYRFRAKPIVTALALIGYMVEATRDGFWRDFPALAARTRQEPK